MRIYNFWNDTTDKLVYGDDLMEYLLESQRNLSLKDGNVIFGCTPSISGADINITAGIVKSNQVTLSFLKNGKGAKILPVARVLANSVTIPEDSTAYVVVQILVSSTSKNLDYYDILASINTVNSRTTVFPSGNLIGEVLIGQATNNNGVVTLDTSNAELSFATQQQVDNAMINDRQIAPDTLFSAYGYNDPVTITADHQSTADEHILQATTAGVIITLNNITDYSKSRRNTVAKRIINLSDGDITIATGSTGTLTLNSSSFSGGSFSSVNIPTVSGGILV